MDKQLNLADPTLSYEFPSLNQLARELVTGPLSSVSSDNNQRLVFGENPARVTPFEGWYGIKQPLSTVAFDPRNEPRIVASVDSSCIPLGWSSTGLILLGKVGVCLSRNGGPIRHYRIGPIISHFHSNSISPNSCNPKLSGSPDAQVLSSEEVALRRTRVIMERKTLNELSRRLSGAILLVDGSLQDFSLPIGSPTISHLLKESQKRANIVIGISKTSKIHGLIVRSSILMDTNEAPICVDVTDLLRSFQNRIRGRIYLVKFSRDGLAFRVDTSDDTVEESLYHLGLIRANDIFYLGYPESLRIAHHLSLISGCELSAARTYLVRNCHFEPLEFLDRRLAILGSLTGCAV